MKEPAFSPEALLKMTEGDGLFFLPFFDELPLGIMIIDASGTPLYCNQAQLEMDGMAARDVIGRPLVETYGVASRATSIMLYCLGTQQPVLNRWQVYQSPGRRTIRAMCHVVPLFRQGRLAGCIALSRHYPDNYMYADYSNASSEVSGDSPETFQFAHLIGRDKAFRQAMDIARAASAAPMPVLIHGETGVGKELFARGIHNASPRGRKPFVAVNCAAVPESLFESLMFGVSPGAFTGAIQKAGFFEEAEGGTIFLDELDSMPLSLQSKLLRVIQEKSARRLGSKTDRPVDVKVISAMGLNPLEAMKQGRLRSDLYFRLGALQISIPPLRERLDDLELLTAHFIAKHAGTLNKQIQRPSQSLVDVFKGYVWPGNVRELEHTITGAMVMAGPRRQTLGPDLLPEYFKNIIFSRRQDPPPPEETRPPSAPGPGRQVAEPAAAPSRAHSGGPHLETSPPAGPADDDPGTDLAAAGHEYEKNIIRQKLAQSYGNVSLAARLMKLSPQSLAYKMKKHGLDRKDFQYPGRDR